MINRGSRGEGNRQAKRAFLATNTIFFFFGLGNYSCLVARFHLSRSVGFHMVQSYIPTILIVVISWVSFWMDVDSVPGRTTLGVTTLLTVSSKSAGKAAFATGRQEIKLAVSKKEP